MDDDLTVEDMGLVRSLARAFASVERDRGAVPGDLEPRDWTEAY